jgi:STI1 domain
MNKPVQAMDELRNAGMDPQAALTTMMKDPELMQLMMKPHVTSALMEIQKDPAKASEYMSDPDVGKLLMKMTQIQMQSMAKDGAKDGASA